MRRLDSFSRLLVFDKRGTGLSDPLAEVQPLEERMEDVRAVMDAGGSDKAALFGFSEGSAMAMLFAATYPERTRSLVDAVRRVAAGGTAFEASTTCLSSDVGDI